MSKRVFPALARVLFLLGGCASVPEFSSDNTALLVIDIQNTCLPVSGQRLFIANVKKLITRAREAGIPVIYIAHTTQYITRNTRGWESQHQGLEGTPEPEGFDTLEDRFFRRLA